MRLDIEHGAQVVRRDQANHMVSSQIEGPSQDLLTGSQQRPRRSRPSPTMWRLVLFMGDGVLLLVLFVPVLFLAGDLQSRLGSSIFELGGWDSKLVWGCLVFVSWSIAVGITQAQEMSNVTSRFKSSLCVLFALVLTFALLTLFSYQIILNEISSYMIAMLLFLVLALPAFCLWRVLLAEVINLPPFRSQAVVVGLNKAGLDLAKELLKARRPAFTVVKYIRADSDSSQNDELSAPGDRNTLSLLIQRGMIDMIIMANDYNTAPELYQLAFEGAQQGISLVPIAIAYERISGKIPVEHIADQWYVSLSSEHIVSPLYLCWHKVMDILFGLAGMILFLLVFPVVSALIYLDSPGPVFYKQERSGLQGKQFNIYKFRSMRPDAEAAGNAMWTSKHDPRITRFGHFMRNVHLDELPQVFNILRGEMSLIGPRPERSAFVEELEKSIPFYRWRLRVKPGLTGWAQVKYGYTSSSEESLEKLQYDLYYIKHRSFMLDVSIILKTVIEVLLHYGR